MNLNNKQLIEIIGLVAVVASLLLLTYELRQANQIARTNARFEMTDSYASLNESVYTNPELAELISKLRNSDFVPSAQEREQIWAYLLRTTNTWIAAEFAYNNGQYPEEVFQGTLEDADKFLKDYPGMHPFWSEYLEDYPTLASNFQVYAIVEEALENTEL